MADTATHAMPRAAASSPTPAITADSAVLALARTTAEEVLSVQSGDDLMVLKCVQGKSLVIRIGLVDTSLTTVVLKLCRTPAALREQLVYEEVLPPLGVSAPRLFGVRDAGDGLTWLALEDAGDTAWSSGIELHRRLATEWLAAAHVRAFEVVPRALLPDRGTGYFRGMLGSAIDVVQEALRNPAVTGEDVGRLERFLELCSRLEDGWQAVESLLARVPPTLTLPGFCGKNVRVRDSGGGKQLLPVDYENAGWGPPVVDLGHVVPARYSELVQPVWALDEAALQALATLGRALFSVKAVPGERSTLVSRWPERSIRRIAHYTDSLDRALGTLGSRRGSE